MTDRTRFVTTFVAHPERLAEAERLYNERVRALDPALGTLVDIDRYAHPSQDEYFLWNLRTTAVYEGIGDVENLQLYQLGCVIDSPELSDADEDRLTQVMFFCDSGPDPFPGFLDRMSAWAPEPEPILPPTISEGTWLVTVYALISRERDVEAEMAALVDALSPTLRGDNTEDADLEHPSVFGPLILRQTQLLLAETSRDRDYPSGRRRMMQRLVITHTGDPQTLTSDDDHPAVFTAERLH